MSAQVQLQPAFVLHRRPYRETSLLVELLSAEYGRVGVIARGARSGRGRNQHQLQPFRPLLISWSGRGELHTLSGAESAGRAPEIGGKLLFSGFYINELIMRLTRRDDPNPELFNAYRQVLEQLAADEEWALRRFECALLDALGYGLILTEDTHGMALEPALRYRYHLERGAEPGVGAGGLAVTGSTLLALAGQLDAGEVERKMGKRLLRAALGLYLGNKPLASRELYRHALADEVARSGTTENKHGNRNDRIG